MQPFHKVAMVTGGATGIGRAIVLRLARANCAVGIVFSTSTAEAAETGAEVNQLGSKAIAIKADVTRDDEVSQAVQLTVDNFGRLDWLINNAGITRQLPFSDIGQVDASVWDELYAVNVKGSFLCSRAAAGYLESSDDGCILNTGSIAGVTGYGSSIPYAVSKAALHGLTLSLARALAPRVRVNAIAPGAVDTRWWEGNEAKMRLLAGDVALKRISTTDDIADTAFAILSAKSMTGQIIVLDNGQTL